MRVARGGAREGFAGDVSNATGTRARGSPGLSAASLSGIGSSSGVAIANPAARAAVFSRSILMATALAA
jgi:hypothetical protein